MIGGGDTAAEEALMLTRVCATVAVVHRRDKLRASPLLAQRVTKHAQITMVWHTVVDAFQASPDARLGAVVLRDVHTNAVTPMPADAAFVAIGHDPNTQMLRGQVSMDATGYLETPARSTQTSVPGVFAAGDVADPTYRQAITSAGSGAAAALDAERWLSAEAE